MGMLAVDTASLDRLSARMRAASAEALALRRSPSLLLTPGPVADFVGAWGSALQLIGDDASRLADAVAAVARLYADVEWANTRAAS